MPNTTSTCRLYYQNVRGIRSKIQQFYPNVCDTHFDIICLTETWLNTDVLTTEIFPSTYNVIRSDGNISLTNRSKGSGVLIALNKEFNFKVLDLQIPPDLAIIDTIGCKILLPSNSLYILNLSV